MGSQSLTDRLLSTFCFCFVSSQPKSYHLTSRDSSELQRLDGDEEEEDWEDWTQSRDTEVQPTAKKTVPQSATAPVSKEVNRPASAASETNPTPSRTSIPSPVAQPQPIHHQFQEASDSDDSYDQHRHKRDEDDDMDDFGDDDDFEALDLTSQPTKKESRNPYIVPRIESSFSDSPAVGVGSAISSSGNTRLGSSSLADGSASQPKQSLSFASSSMPRVNSGKLNLPPPPPAASSQAKLILGQKEEIAASDDIDLFSELGMEPEIKAPKVIVAPAIKKETFSSALSAPEDLGDLSAWD